MTECGGNITSLGELYSPSYPFYYGESIDCTWIIHLPEGQYVQIDLLDVDLAVSEINTQVGGYKSNLADSFTVYDRNVREPKIFETSGGTLKINPITRLISTSNTLEINLKSSYRFSETGARGFAINISKSDCAGCGVGEISCSTGAKCLTSCGYISSRNFPDFYDVSSSCSWKIQGVVGQYVVATFLQLDVIGNEKCEGDFVNLYDLGLNDNRFFLGKYCKHHRPVYSINSNGHKMEVELYSDFSVVGSGFMLKYELRTITLQTTTQNSTGCDVGWRGFENSCYKFDISNKPITWTSARSLCAKQGGHLVSINGIREMEFLHSTILLHSPFSTRSAYIGLEKIQNGTFLWVDGKPLSYSAWYEDETSGRRQPDGFDQELCSFMTIASIRSLKSWHDVACAYNQLDQFICEKNKAIHELFQKINLID
ncbi:dorsal-ventral patterning protein tolloid [Patella vulgata]|uniref:dorsal-ventral patterning protein tolloid n=1 Tax=Patella vulgata TaxID=6465 RepID=UPI00217F40DB|nr:dorsal-ventral patterning protein tolloid [Patella vulgata]